MTSVVFVAGARPNFMKIAPVLRALPPTLAPTLVHTGQHYDFDMSGVFFEQLGLPAPDVHLQVGSASHGVQTGRIMAELETWLVARPERPAGVVVVGDVNSTMAAALVGVKLGIPVAHVEAGLRSGDRTMPEEINRIVTDAVSDLLLVSEPSGLSNLVREGVPTERVTFTGNVMIDTLVAQLPAARALAREATFGERYALVTLHRASNVDSAERLGALVGLVEQLSRVIPVVMPLHPRTAKQLDACNLRARLAAMPAIRVTPPLPYREFLGAMDAASVVVTDSGGVQEETTYLGVPCVTLRNTTERPITIERGTNVLAGEDLATAFDMIAAAVARGRTATSIDGWDGHAAERVAATLAAAWT